jgi:hypothetical protein
MLFAALPTIPKSSYPMIVFIGIYVVPSHNPWPAGNIE